METKRYRERTQTFYRKQKGKKQVVLRQEYDLELCVCRNGFQTFCLNIDDDTAIMIGEAIAAYLEHKNGGNETLHPKRLENKRQM